ncbi:hypothetical protein JEQ05_17690 [Serratia liquefaciens]|uniref:hypothetical protein n=1 Tax=Serratia liquefaciens TaxID=614 RepID=UPI00101F555C|nr:hypothetical protein [Serratia liquefaciens]MBI6163463.1 hypothetical protein [Serratia liquefaciens]RYM69839.1 hypothetical protein BSR00_20795 [Serratia liquefaciens]RYM76137.1 hypothetical protein BSR01_22470 [Serratia liquefaciens]
MCQVRGKSHKVDEQMHFFIALGASAFDAATDLAYKGYRIEHRGFFVSAKTPLKTYGFPPAAWIAIYSVAKLPRVLR